jgi:DNA-binding CsgD family transcriptional regulator
LTTLLSGVLPDAQGGTGALFPVLLLGATDAFIVERLVVVDVGAHEVLLPADDAHGKEHYRKTHYDYGCNNSFCHLAQGLSILGAKINVLRERGLHRADNYCFLEQRRPMVAPSSNTGSAPPPFGTTALVSRKNFRIFVAVILGKMKNQKLYEADDTMISIIRDNSNILQSLGSFGISLGFGDKTVREVCEGQQVDTRTFLAVVNFTINGYYNSGESQDLSVGTLLKYLKASHVYYIDFQLPYIRKELTGALDADNSLTPLIMRLYDQYAHDIIHHMKYEEKTLFPYVEKLLSDTVVSEYNFSTFSKHHYQVDEKLRELKNIMIKYLPSDGLHNNLLTATLYDIYNNEEWLSQHANVEEQIFIPAIRALEKKLSQKDITQNISKMIGATGVRDDQQLSEREKEVIVSIVQGMSNKEIAEHLFISVNTVITHRRNIARKLQIHSAAGLTIYAIVNNLIDISLVKL